MSPMSVEESLWAELQLAWDAWRSGPDANESFDTVDNLNRVSALHWAVDSWPEAERDRPIEWLRRRIAAGEQPGIWRVYNPSGIWGDAIFDHDDDPRAELLDGVCLDHCELQPHQHARLVRRARQVRELVLIECNILPSIEALFAPPATWSSLERLHVEATGNENDLRAIWRAQLPALHEFVLLDEEPLLPMTVELTAAPWWRQLRTLRLGHACDDILAALAASDMPLLEQLVLTEPSVELRQLWSDPIQRPRLQHIEAQTR